MTDIEALDVPVNLEEFEGWQCPLCGGDPAEITPVKVPKGQLYLYEQDAYQLDDGSWWIDTDCCGVLV